MSNAIKTMSSSAVETEKSLSNVTTALINMSSEQVVATASMMKMSAAQTATAMAAKSMSASEIASELATRGFSKATAEAALIQAGFAPAVAESTVAQYSFATAEGTATVATNSFTASIAAATEGLITFLATNPVGWAILAVGAIWGLVKVYDALTISYEEALEQAEKSQQAYEEQKSKVNSLNSELETTRERLEELESKDSLNIVEQEELENLRTTNELLREQLEIEQAIENMKLATARNDAIAVLSNKDFTVFGDTSLNGKTAFEQNLATSAAAYGHGYTPPVSHSADVVEYTIARQEYLNSLTEDRNNLIKEQNKLLDESGKPKDEKAFNDYSNRISNINDKIKAISEEVTENWQTISEQEKYLFDANGNAFEGQEERIQQINQLRDMIVEYATGVSQVAKTKQSKIDSFLDRPSLEKDVSAVKELAGELNGLTFDEIKEKFPALAAEISSFASKTGISIEDVVNSINSLGSNVNTKNIEKDLSEVKNSIIKSLIPEQGILPAQLDNTWLEVSQWIDSLSDEQIEILYGITESNDVSSWSLEDFQIALENASEAAGIAGEEISQKLAMGYEAVKSAVSDAAHYQEILNNVFREGDTVTKDVYDSLTALLGSEEAVGAYIDKNNGYVVTNAEGLRDIADAANEAVKSNLRLSESQEMLKYHELVSTLRTVVEGTDDYSEKTMDVVSAIMDEIDATQLQIAQYKLLEQQLLGTTSAFDKLADAQALDAARDYTDDLADSISGLIKSFENHEFGTEYFKTAFDSLIPKDIYKQFTDAGDQLDAGWDYLNTKLSRYFTFDENNVSIDFENIKAFVEDGLNQAFGDSTVFLGDLEDFSLNSQITTLSEFAEAMGLTETAAFSLANAISKYTTDNDDFLSKLAMDGATLETQMLSCDQTMASLLKKQVDLGHSGKVGTEEWEQLQKEIAACDQEMGQLQTKARESIHANIKIDSDIEKKYDEVESLKSALDSLNETDASYSVTLKNYEKAQEELNALIQQKYDLDEPVAITVEVALEQIQAEIDSTKSELDKIAEFDGQEYSLKAEFSTETDTFNDLVAELDRLEQEKTEIEVYAGIENKDDIDAELNSIQDFKIDDKEFKVKANTYAAMTALAGILSQLAMVKDKSITVTTYAKTVTSTVKSSKAYGNAHAYGTAYEHGVWGTKTAEKDALLGELGEEIVVDPQSGEWTTVGEHGAEMMDLPKGAIVFNHMQTKELLKNRHINSRGVALAKGNAYFAGFGTNNNYTFGNLSGNSTTSSSSSSSNSNSVSVTVEPKVDNKSLEEQLEETLKKMKETIDDVIGNFEHQIFIKEKNGAATEKIVAIYKSMQKYVHEQANAYRKLGLDENSDYIQDLQKQWWEYEDSIRELRIQAYEDIIKEHQNAVDVNKIWLDKAVEDNNRAGVTKYTYDIVEHYKAMQEELHKEAEYYRSLGYADTSDEVSSLMKKWWDYYEEIKSVSAEAWQAILDNAHEAVDEIVNLYDTMKKAAQEYDESGFVTVKTFQELAKLGVENLAYLEDENGLLVINKENIEKVIAARTEQMAVETALNYVQQIRSALMENNVVELSRLTMATQIASSSTWDLVYAQLQLAKSEGLSDDMFIGALNNINNLRALADTTVVGIGKIEGGIEEARKTAHDAIQKQSDALKDILKYVEEMIKQEIKNQIEAINDQIDGMKDLVDLQKKSLDLEKEKQKYSQSVAEKTKEMAKIQQELALLELDDSRESLAKQAKLREQLADLSNDLADEQSDHAIDATKDSLDEMFASYKKEKEKEIAVLEDSISSEEKLYRLAIERIETQWDTLYQQLIDWNYQYGTVTNDEITAAWNAASEAVKQYGSYLNAILETQKQIDAYKSSSSSSSSTTTTGGGTGGDANTPAADNSPTTVGKTGNYDTSGGAEMEAVHNIIKQMYANSRAWNAADKTERARLDAENLRLGEQLLRYGISAYRENGTWYVANGKKLYEVYKNYIYHEGGVAGNDPTLKQDEILAKIQKGELILNENQQDNLYRILDEQETLLSKYGGLISSLTNSDLMGTKMQAQLKQDVQQAQAAVYGSGDTIYNNLTVPVQVLQKLSAAEIDRLTEAISKYTIDELDEVFGLRGKRSFRR